jgi:hypothetical protein
MGDQIVLRDSGVVVKKCDQSENCIVIQDNDDVVEVHFEPSQARELARHLVMMADKMKDGN